MLSNAFEEVFWNTFQNDKVFQLFDNDTLAESGAFPMDYRGVPVSGALRYPEILEDYGTSKTAMFKNSNPVPMPLFSRLYAVCFVTR